MLLPVLQFPDPRLKKVAEPVSDFDDKLKAFVADLFETMYEEQGIGLAATQVDRHIRVIAIDLDGDPSDTGHEGTPPGPICLINPQILKQLGSVISDEGCLSFPGVFDKVTRAEEIEVSYFDAEGQAHTRQAGGLLSICIQHEIDHLNGITFYDHLSPLKKERLKRKMQRNHKRVL